MSLINSIKHQFKYGNNTIKIETGILSKQANSSVLINMDDTVVLISIVEKEKKIISNQLFFPLTVNYYERSYASGKFPMNFLRREGKPSENEILISRLIDRSIRPLFDKNYLNEVQITVTVLSLNTDFNPDIISIIGVSTALSISEIPFIGPIGIARVGYINGEFILNPSFKDLKDSKLDLIISGTNKCITMIESMSDFLPESIIMNAIEFGYNNQFLVIDNIKKFKNNINENKIISDFVEKNDNLSLYSLISSIAYDQLNIAYSVENKLNRCCEIEKIKYNTVNQITNIISDSQNNDILINFNILEKEIVRNKIINNNIRIDGRSYDSIRDIYSKIGFLPRVHGSSLFIRGNTQSLVSVTLGNEKNGQIVDNYDNDYIDKFLFHYNFPSYSVGEIGNSFFPKRREIGHGKLAKRSLIPSIPTFDKFPYVIRVVSEITESDGSSSMASVCGASLALMDAGVPIKSSIAGIAMGLIKEKNKIAILSDISGCEDYFGDLDLKVSGGINGITAIQMDIKADYITLKIIDSILIKSFDNIIKIIGLMDQTIFKSKNKISDFAPRLFKFKIDKNKIKDVIGKGGSVIKSIIKETKSSIDVSDDGTINIYSINNELANKAILRIKDITSNVIEGKIYQGIITSIVKFGIFVLIKNKIEGLIHISKINIDYTTYNINEFKIGQKVCVKVIEIDKNGKVRLCFSKI